MNIQKVAEKATDKILDDLCDIVDVYDYHQINAKADVKNLRERIQKIIIEWMDEENISRQQYE